MSIRALLSVRTPAALAFIALVVIAAAALVGVVADRVYFSRRDPETRAMWLARAGKHAAAEELYWRALHESTPTTTLLIAFLDNHAVLEGDREAFGGGERPSALPSAKVDESRARGEDEIDSFLASDRLSAETALLGRYWLAALRGEQSAEARMLVEAAADAPHPLPFANHLLGREAWSRGRDGEAASRFELEGSAFPEHAEDVDVGLSIRMRDGDWATVEARLRDPLLRARASDHVRFRYALHVRDWAELARTSLGAVYAAPSAGPLVLAVLTALAWFAFCARLGAIQERPLVRVPLYLVAFALGVLSIYPTIMAIYAQEEWLHLKESGRPLHDLVYYVLGVGLREELSKALLFAALLPALRRWGTKLDVLVCGSLVGLGFAAAENLGYFAHGDLSTAMARFLTANFLHIAMTGLTAVALDDFARAPEAKSFDFTRTLMTVMAMHGVYDYLLSSGGLGNLSFFAMIVFFLLTHFFLREVERARPRAGRGIPLLNVFIVATASVVGATFVYACSLVGPAVAALASMQGMLGVAIVFVVFVRQLDRL